MDNRTIEHPAEVSRNRDYLTTIPVELRDAILQYLLVSPEELSYSTSLVPVAPENKVKVPLAIACTCRQLFWEVLPIYYGKNEFGFHDLDCMYNFLKYIGARRRPYVKTIALTLKYYGNAELKNMGRDIPRSAMALLCECGPLKKLTVCPITPSTGSFLRVAGVKELRKVRSCKELLVDRYFAVLAGPGGHNEAKVDELERVLREEICREPESRIETQARIAKEEEQRKQNREAEVGVEWQARLRRRT